MLSQPITFAEDLFPLTYCLLLYLLICLYITGVLLFVEIKSYRRQGKHWIWHKSRSVIKFLMALTFAIGLFLFFAPIVTLNGTDIKHLPPYSTGLRVLIAVVGVSIALIGAGSLELYRHSLLKKEKKEEQVPDPRR